MNGVNDGIGEMCERGYRTHEYIPRSTPAHKVEENTTQGAPECEEKRKRICELPGVWGGEGFWYSRPSELVSHKRDWQRLVQAFCASCRSGRLSPFWARGCLAQARRSRLSELVQRAIVLNLWGGGGDWDMVTLSSGVSNSVVSREIHHKCKHPLNPTKLYVSEWVESES